MARNVTKQSELSSIGIDLQLVGPLVQNLGTIMERLSVLSQTDKALHHLEPPMRFNTTTTQVIFNAITVKQNAVHL